MNANVENFFTENTWYQWVGGLGPYESSGVIGTAKNVLAKGVNKASEAMGLGSSRFQGPQGLANAKNNVILGGVGLLSVMLLARLLNLGGLGKLCAASIIVFNIAPGLYVWTKRAKES